MAQTLVDFYTDVYVRSPVGSGFEAAASNALDVLAGTAPVEQIAAWIAEAREAIDSAVLHYDDGAITYYTQKISLLEQFHARLSHLAYLV